MTSVFSFFYDTCFPFFKATIVIIPFDQHPSLRKSSQVLPVSGSECKKNSKARRAGFAVEWFLRLQSRIEKYLFYFFDDGFSPVFVWFNAKNLADSGSDIGKSKIVILLQSAVVVVDDERNLIQGMGSLSL